jgi:hypothetical protein
MPNRRERRNKVFNRGLDGAQQNHAKYVRTYRHHVMRVVRDIEQGTVEVEDMARLRNFCQMAITLMEKAPLALIQSAWRDTEILSFEHQNDETAVVLKDEIDEYLAPENVSGILADQ